MRAGHQGDLDRIVRYVSRREVGLVLSGGGARGFAHAGVVRAIQEAGLPIDVIAGVSMGAVMAAGYAFSEQWEETIPLIKAQLEGVFSDYTLPFVSLARGRRFDRYLQALFGDASIEDLRMPYFCVSSNLTRADTVVHRTGPLWRAIRASGSLPGLVPPVVDDGDLLYDGGLLNNLPVDLMRKEIHTGVLIAVDVVPPVDLGIRATGLESPSGWRIAWSRLNPLTKAIEMPSIVSILQRVGSAVLQGPVQALQPDATDRRDPMDNHPSLEEPNSTLGIGRGAVYPCLRFSGARSRVIPRPHRLLRAPRFVDTTI